MTQNKAAARRFVVSISCFAYHKMLRLLPNRGLVGSQGLKRTMKKKNAQRRHLRQNSLPNEDFRLKRLYQPKKALFSKLRSSTFYLQTALFKFYLQTAFLKIYLQTLFFKCYLQVSISAFFCQIVQFQVIENFFKSFEKVSH